MSAIQRMVGTGRSWPRMPSVRVTVLEAATLPPRLGFSAAFCSGVGPEPGSDAAAGSAAAAAGAARSCRPSSLRASAGA